MERPKTVIRSQPYRMRVVDELVVRRLKEESVRQGVGCAELGTYALGLGLEAVRREVGGGKKSVGGKG